MLDELSATVAMERIFVKIATRVGHVSTSTCVESALESFERMKNPGAVKVTISSGFLASSMEGHLAICPSKRCSSG